MAGSRSRLKANAEWKFPVRLRILVPESGFGTKGYMEIHNWLVARYGLDGFAWTGGMMPGYRDASLFFFPDLAGAVAFMEQFPSLEFAADSEMSLR